MKTLLAAAALLVAACESHAVGRLASVELMNRDTGQILPVYRARGEYWVAGTPGARYAVLVHNLTGERLLAVTSVDGVNVISGETAAFAQAGYVFSPGQAYTIDGWRKSDREIAAFNFTSLPDSYAARTGRAANSGVIGLALFLEQPAPLEPFALPPAVFNEAVPADQAGVAGDAAPPLSTAPAPAQRRAQGAQVEQAAKLGTGHGAREYSYVSDTKFERRSERPNEIIRIRYDRYENLVAMGVLRARALPAAAPDPFPDSGSGRYVPDPPGP